MGIINHLGKFSNRLTELTQPLRELLSKNNSWTWDTPQDTAFTHIKEELTDTLQCERRSKNLC